MIQGIFLNVGFSGLLLLLILEDPLRDQYDELLPLKIRLGAAKVRRGFYYMTLRNILGHPKP